MIITDNELNLIIIVYLQISIKQQEQLLQTEIEDIASKFHHLLDTVGVDSDTNSGIMAPPSTPSFLKTTAASLTQVTKLETPTFLRQTPTMSTYCLSDSSSDETCSMFPESLDALVNKSDGLPLNVSNLSTKTMLVDSNSNYLESPHSELNDNDTPVIEAIPSLDKTSPSTDSSSPTSSCESSSSSHRMSSSDGYPKSDESTDNQIVPECYDLDKEFMSRLQYYSDFTVDRQRKIDSIVTSYAAKDNSPCEVTDTILTRHVEGKEASPEKPAFVKPMAPPPSATSGSDYFSTPHRQRRDRAQRYRHTRSNKKISSKPIANSTMLDTSFSSSSSGKASYHGNSLLPKASSTLIYESESSNGSGRRNRTNGSNPRACSTMLNESFLSSGSSGSSGSRHKSLPMANSTMIIPDLPAMVPCGAEPTISVIQHDNTDLRNACDNDCDSVFTWSIHEDNSGSDQDISLEESYMKKVSPQKMNVRPPLPQRKRGRNHSASSKDSDCEQLCKDHKLHELLGEPCSKTIVDNVSAIEPSDTCREQALFVESMCGDMTDCVLRCNTLPRSSTRVKLQDKSSGSSSMDARRNSLPDLTSVGTSNNEEQSVPVSFSDDEYSAGGERPDCQGKSSSSNDNPNAGTSQGSGNIDSILTDSPNSVCSSGINAPYNSPGTNASSSSHVSVSTTSDAKSSDSNINTRAPYVKLLPRNMQVPANSPKVQNIPSPNGAVFKVPKQTQPLKNLFRFRRKSKTPDVKTSTPKPTPANGQPNSKRQLFSSAATTNLQGETKVMDKKAVIRKFKKFSDSFRQKDRAGKPQIQTLANL